nr:expressed protein [Hymenolepis microstoma]
MIKEIGPSEINGNRIIIDIPENLQGVSENRDGCIHIYFKSKEREKKITEDRLLQDCVPSDEATNVTNSEMCLAEGAYSLKVLPLLRSHPNRRSQDQVPFKSTKKVNKPDPSDVEAWMKFFADLSPLENPDQQSKNKGHVLDA